VSHLRQQDAHQPDASRRPGQPAVAEPADVTLQKLVIEAQGGDQRALEDLLNKHADLVFAMCLRMCGNVEDARDLSQDVLVKAIEALQSFDGRAKFSTWITRIAMNHCLTHRRRQRLRSHTSLESPGTSQDASATLAQTLEQSSELSGPSRVEQGEMQQVLRLAMQDLDPESRALLILRDVRDLDYAQISEVLDIPLGTVKSRLFRARATLRERIESRTQDPPGASERE
jgi:RNA polymerase sigma-70 factor (ECF subfamily)